MEKETPLPIIDSFLKTLSGIFGSKKAEKQVPAKSEGVRSATELSDIVEFKKAEQEKKEKEQIRKALQINQSILRSTYDSIPGTKILYKKYEDLGKGGFGNVFVAEFPDYRDLELENKKYAVKKINFKSTDPNLSQEKAIQRFLTKNLNEKYIADRIQKEAGCLKEFLCYYFPNNEPIIDKDYNIWIISELMTGDLNKLMKVLDLEERVDFVNEHLFPTVIKGISDLHEMGLIHSDIKLENILYKDVNDEEIQVKIGDMGGTCTLLFNELKKQSTDKDCKNCKICLNRFRGTLPYLDPKLYEKFLENVYTGNFTKENLWIKNTDWYGFAITLIHFLVGKNIISNRELQRIMQYAAKKEYTLENLIEMYRAYISTEIKFAIDDHKDKWLKFGLRPDILKFIEVNTINYI